MQNFCAAVENALKKYTNAFIFLSGVSTGHSRAGIVFEEALPVLAPTLLIF